MSGVEYSVSVRAKNGVSDMVPLELRNASTVPVIMHMTSTSMTSDSSAVNLVPIISGIMCSLVLLVTS